MRGRTALALVVVLTQIACGFGAPSGGGPAGNGPDAATQGETFDAPAASCTEGAVCDDMKACTQYDVCSAGGCRGTPTAACTGCASTCDETCGGASCCEQSCPGGSCPTCPAGCSCELSCGSNRPCEATCGAGSVCNVRGTDNEADGNYNVTCAAGSICSVDCVGDEGRCTLDCAADARCLLDCSNKSAGSCNLVGCTGTVTTCPGNIKVCNRPCP